METSPLATWQRVCARLGTQPRGLQAHCACPAHHDRKPSLTAKLDPETGKVLLCCGAGCDTEAILKAAGLEWGDLFTTRRAPRGPATPGERGVIAVHRYCDPDGVHLATKVHRGGARHWELPDGSKADGRIAGLPISLYRIERLAVTSPETPVWLVAGERDAEAIQDELDRVSEDGVAVSLPHGDTSWRHEWASWFAGRVVVLWPDGDPSGWRAAQKISGDLAAVALEIEIIESAGGHNDARDHLEAGLALTDTRLCDPTARLAGHVNPSELVAAVASHPFPGRHATSVAALATILARHANTEGTVQLAKSTMVAETGRTKRTVDAHLAVLASLDVIEVVEQGGFHVTDNAYTFTSTTYRFKPVTCWKTPESQTCTLTPSPHRDPLVNDPRRKGATMGQADWGADVWAHGGLGHSGVLVVAAVRAGLSKAADIVTWTGLKRSTVYRLLVRAASVGLIARREGGWCDSGGSLTSAARQLGTAGRRAARAWKAQVRDTRMRAMRARWVARVRAADEPPIEVQNELAERHQWEMTLVEGPDGELFEMALAA